MHFTVNEISFLRDVQSSIKVDMRSGWRHHFCNGLNSFEISSFIKFIDDDKIYLIIPLITTSVSLSKPTLNLSEPFLINNKSNSDLITKFILEQWNSSGFNINQDTTNMFAFKFKRVTFSSYF
jgi:hypothetical protein